MSLPDLLTIGVIVVAVPLSWVVAALLWSFSRSAPDVKVLRAHAFAALALALLVSVFAAIFINNSLIPPPLNNVQTQIVTRAALLLVSTASALYWLRFVWRSP